MSDLEALRREHYNAAIEVEQVVAGAIMVFRVHPDRPIPEPKPGQWLELGLGVWEPVAEGAEPGTPKRIPPDGLIRRAYSLSSPILTPDRDGLVERTPEDGFEFFLSLVIPPAQRAEKVPNLTGRLFGLKTGGRLFMSDQPLGRYTLDPVRPDDDVLFLATGTGEAPHNAMIWDLLRRGHRGRVASVVSVRNRRDLAYDAIHRRLTELFPRYRYQAMATREPDSDGRHLQDLLRDGTLEEQTGLELNPGRTQVFLCGNPGMIGPPRNLQGKRIFPESTGLVEILESERGFNAEPDRGRANVHYERYW
jgi:ferredoxin--NADP+ reductase